MNSDITEGSVLVSVDKLIMATDNHGGYYGVLCALCYERGWDGKLEHKSTCPLRGVASREAAKEISKRKLSVQGSDEERTKYLTDVGVIK